ncbi:porphobilinogen deaminase [Piedraia hortae CBS 480.64]|uniref:hydroxymethylbilane synthase n=1 Tax=Piedraia hortae CBS 480.64 TaxID=1314780 RepID=A0A6A7C6Y2_9PEZI|nr:porphobilinogen deaminase [Piedraia hortae CBS 480.64]
MAAKEFRIGSRDSALAKIQTHEVIKFLQEAWPDEKFEMHAMSTKGDKNLTTALHKFNDKSLWTQELEVKLHNGELDFIVHSLKDMPTQLPEGMTLACVIKREDPRDALVVKPALADSCKNLAELPGGSVVGTSSLRRIAQLKRQHKHLKFEDVRGNIGTRLAKLDDPEGKYDAIVLAVAGLERMGMGARITKALSSHEGGMLHAVGQGALGVEARSDDQRVEQLLKKVGDDRTTREVLVERSVLRTLEGGCSVPIGVETEWVRRSQMLPSEGRIGVQPAEHYEQLTGVSKDEKNEEDLTDELIIRAIVLSLDGSEVAEVEHRRIITTHDEANKFGQDVANDLKARGATKILGQIK